MELMMQALLKLSEVVTMYIYKIVGIEIFVKHLKFFIACL